jgi:hypothetical protein
MSTSNFTPKAIESLLRDSEQLSLLLMMLFDQKLDLHDLNIVAPPLLLRLNDNIQRSQALFMLHNQFQYSGGMGEAPMLSAS